MDSRNDIYFTNLLDEDSNIDEEICTVPQYLNQSAEVSTQTSQFSNEVRSTLKKTPRSGNFCIEEDELLVSAWLNISLDAVQGNEQKHTAFWTRVHAFFHKHKKFSSERSQKSLANRWSAIQLATNKFCWCLSQIESRHQSGMTKQGKVNYSN